MSVPENLTKLRGDWKGDNRLWLDPLQPADVSAGTATVGLAAQGQFLTLHYTWAVNGEPQDGLLIAGCALNSDQAMASWIDSWHMAHQIMSLHGSLQADGTLSLLGSYAAPPGPDWGWRIVLDAREAGRLMLKMFNIAPETFEIPTGRSREELAVEAAYTHRPA